MTRRLPQRRWCNKPRIRQAQLQPHLPPLSQLPQNLVQRLVVRLPYPRRQPELSQPAADIYVSSSDEPLQPLPAVALHTPKREVTLQREQLARDVRREPAPASPGVD